MKKKFFIITLTFLFIIMTALPIFAADEIGKGIPVLDGKKDEIYTVSLSYPNSPLYHDTAHGNMHPADVPSEIKQSLDATTYLLWDETHIYFFLEAIDDDFYGANDSSLSYWAQGDGVILMYYPDATDDNTMYNKLRVAYSAETFNATQASVYSAYPDQVEYKYLETDVGYNLEIFITLGENTLKEGDVIQFATQVCDIGPDYARGYAYVNDAFAQITFPRTLGSEAVVIIEEIAAETPLSAPITSPQTNDTIIIAVILMILSLAIPKFNKKIYGGLLNANQKISASSKSVSGMLATRISVTTVSMDSAVSDDGVV